VKIVIIDFLRLMLKFISAVCTNGADLLVQHHNDSANVQRYWTNHSLWYRSNEKFQRKK